jgi:hypothetical protein
MTRCRLLLARAGVVAVASVGLVSFEAGGGDLCDAIVELVEEGPSRTVVEVSWPQSLPAPRQTTFVLAVPDASGARARWISSQASDDVSWLSEAQRAGLANDFVHVEPALRFRGQWLCSVQLRSHRRTDAKAPVERLLRARIEFTTASGDRRFTAGSSSRVDPLLDLALRQVVNPGAARTFAAPTPNAGKGGAIADPFAASAHWLRVEVVQTGIHRVGYEELVAELGAARTQLIQPETLRLLSPPRALQPMLPSDDSGSWALDYALREHAIEVRGSGAFAPGDEILFYAAGPEAWSDRLGVGSGALEHFEHPFADHLVYWLTWDEVGESSGFPAAPLRMFALNADPAGADLELDHYRERLHLEQNLTDQYGLVPDNWVWSARVNYGAPFFVNFDLSDVVAESLATLHTQLFARRPPSGNSFLDNVMELRVNGAASAQLSATWLMQQQENFSLAPLARSAAGIALLSGANVLQVDNRSEADAGGGRPALVIDGFDLSFRRRLVPQAGRLEWTVFEDELAAPQRRAFRIDDASAGWDDALWLDTADPILPRILAGASVEAGATRVRLAASLQAGVRAQFAAAKRSGFLRPRALREHAPRRLRSQVAGAGAGWNMVVLHPAAFADPAQRLADSHAGDLYGYAQPRVAAIDVQDVYDEFGHGVKEPAAIRNFLKFLWEFDNSIAYACLLGDGSRDYRNRLPGASPEPFAPERDQVPSPIQTQYPANAFDDLRRAYAADDWYGCMDDPQPRLASIVYIDLPEIALGRLPAGDLNEANELVDRTLEYQSDPEPGRWRNTILMAADDEVALANGNRNERDHIDEAECISEYFLANSFRLDKLYLTEFPSLASQRAKPVARQEFKSRWNEGRLIVHYIGHGSPTQMADENVFSIEDVGDLANGMRRPLFLAFSCDVAIFDSPTTKSMSEQLILARQGGAIATIAATEVTFITPNENLTEAFYPNLFPDPFAASVPVGLALILAKQQVQSPSISAHAMHNNQKYVLLGDPALRLQSPTQAATLSGDVADAIRTGQLQTLIGQLENGAEGGDSGEYFADLRESARFVSYQMEGGSPTPLEYRLDGESFFLGRGVFSTASAQTQLVPPVDMRFGDHGRIELLLDTSDALHLAVSDDHPVRRSAVTLTDVTGPAIELSFDGGGNNVASGAGLNVTIADSSGINQLGTAPLNSILVEMDRDGYPIDVSRLFELDAGSYERGSLRYNLPDGTPAGPHELEVRASDMLGNVGKAQIRFQVVAAGTLAISAHAVYPNPFRSDANFVIDLTEAPQDVEVLILSVDGRPIRRLREAGGGQQSLVLGWDGRDEEGDDVANGVYLYRVRARFAGEPALSQVRMGRIVRMR